MNPLVRHLTEPRLRRRWLIAALCLLLGPIPLVGTLGYFSSLVLGPALALAGVAVGVDDVRLRRDQGGAPLARLATVGLREVVFLWIVAVALLLTTMLWQRNCDPVAGLAFFAMGPLCSGALGWVCGLWGGTLATRRHIALGLGVTPFVASLAVGLWRLYADPAVFAFDPFWGYFSGAIYDEDVRIGSRYLWFRAYNGLAAAAALMLWTCLVDPAVLRVRRRARSLQRLVVALGLAAAAVSVGARATDLGFHTNEAGLSDALSMTRTTEHFVIHYPPRSPAAREIDAIATEHEFAWSRLESIVGHAPAHPVHTFIFASPDQKRALMGAGRVEVAPPWRGHLYLNYKPFPHANLSHELAHAFEMAIGDPIFGLSINGFRLSMGLVEGLASALAPRSVDGFDIHDQAAVLDRLGKRPPLAKILGTGFWARAGRHAYTAAGSFVAWLMDEYGTEAVVKLYRSGGDFQAAVGVPLAPLEGAWLDFLRSRPVNDETVTAFEERFRVRPIFQRPCAHRVAHIARTAARAEGRGDTEEVLAAREDLCRLEPERPEHQLALADTLSRAGRFAGAREVLTRVLDTQNLTTALRAAAAQRQGDVALSLGDLTASREAFGRALRQPIGENAARVLELKYLATSDPELAPLVADYFDPFDGEDDGLSRAVIRGHMAQRIRALPGYRALGSYLVGLQMLNVQNYEEAVHLLERALQPGAADGTLPGSRFRRAARERLVSAYLVTGRYARALAVLDLLEADPEARSGRLSDYAIARQRVAFFQRTGAGDRSGLTAQK